MNTIIASGGWEYAPTLNSVFSGEEKTVDYVKRRRWHRRLIPVGPDSSPCIFKLDQVQHNMIVSCRFTWTEN